MNFGQPRAAGHGAKGSWGTHAKKKAKTQRRQDRIYLPYHPRDVPSLGWDQSAKQSTETLRPPVDMEDSGTAVTVVDSTSSTAHTFYQLSCILYIHPVCRTIWKQHALRDTPILAGRGREHFQAVDRRGEHFNAHPCSIQHTAYIPHKHHHLEARPSVLHCCPAL
jgi:hypothetical protein